MADWQHAFLSKVILDQEMRSAVSAGITVEFIRDDRYKRVYEFLSEHYSRYGTPADEPVVHQAFPTLEWKPQKQALDYLIDQMRRDRQFVLITAGLSEAAGHLDTENAGEMMRILQGAMTQARVETSAALDIRALDIPSHQESMLMERMDNPGSLRGISTGFRGIDFVTGGFQPEQFIVLLGTPKSFKSATLLAMALAVHNAAKTPLFIGFEMSNQEQMDRITSLMSGIGLSKILHGTLTAREFKTVQQALNRLEQMREFVLSTDITSATTLSGVQAKVQEYQPDVVFVDGAYLMQTELAGVDQGSPQALTSISRGFKRMAQSLKLPFVVTTQASLLRSKGGLNIGSPMYSSAWSQDCDVLLGVERQNTEKDQPTDNDVAMVKFRVIDSRSGPRKETLLEWDWPRGRVNEIDPEEVRAELSVGNRRAHAHQDDGDTWT